MIRPLVLFLSLATYALATTCHFDLELTWGRGSPDGFERDMIYINGQFPGPLLEIQQGDWVEITVVNKMPFNTTIHAHGKCSPAQSMHVRPLTVLQALNRSIPLGLMVFLDLPRDRSSLVIASLTNGTLAITEATSTMHTAGDKSTTAVMDR